MEKEERLATPLMRSFKFRHPWLQINLLTVFISAAVVGMFQDTIDKISAQSLGVSADILLEMVRLINTR